MSPILKRQNKRDNKIQWFISISLLIVVLVILSLPKETESEMLEINTEEKTLEEYIEEAPVEKTSMSAIYDEIIIQAENYGVDRDTAVRIADCESNLDTRAENPNSSAKGVYQFISGTWDAYCDGIVFDYKANIKCFMIYYPLFPNWWECK